MREANYQIMKVWLLTFEIVCDPVRANQGQWLSNLKLVYPSSIEQIKLVVV